MIEPDRLRAAYRTVRSDLLAARGNKCQWTGHLSSSPLSTATAISALVLAEQHGRRGSDTPGPEQLYQGDLSELVVESLYWLARHQNADGGWGDTDKSLSNISTTMLVCAAFHLTGVPCKYADLLVKAEAYIKAQGGVPALKRRYGRDKTFAVPILTNCALAGLVPWREVPPLPFELACVPQSLYRFLQLPVVSYAIPALVAIGQARYFHRKPVNPLVRAWRRAAVEPSLKVLERMQPESGGFLEATPLTSFVVMSLASIGKADHPVARRGVEFLLASVRSDGSWPIDTNLATWNTSLSIGALSVGQDDPDVSGPSLDWLLSCQHTAAHPYTGSPPGGWAWTDLSGGVPDADDTSAALLALARAWKHAGPSQRERIEKAAHAGAVWLLNLQNRDGGWPTFCRGWGRLPFDRSGCDLTAHALRALHAWRKKLGPRKAAEGTATPAPLQPLRPRIEQATTAGLQFLETQQRSDGSWLPLWFGNQYIAEDENPLYGTARVLLAYRDLGRMDSQPAQRGLRWLAGAQQSDGGWGGGPAAVEKGFSAQCSTVEETAVAVEALLAAAGDPSLQTTMEQGLGWLVRAVETGAYRETAPIGLYFAKLWYHERLYPYIFAASALGQAIAVRSQPENPPSTPAHLSRF